MEKSKDAREYPPIYEKIIPVALWGDRGSCCYFCC